MEKEVKLPEALQMNESDALERESMDLAKAIMLSLARPSSMPRLAAKTGVATSIAV